MTPAQEIAAFLKDRDEALGASADHTDEERIESANALLEIILNGHFGNSVLISIEKGDQS